MELSSPLFQYPHFQLPSNNVDKDTGRDRRRNNYGKVKTDVEPGFEDCGNIAEFERIDRPGDTQSTQSKLESFRMCGRPAAEDSNQDDAASSSHVWQWDAKTKETCCCRDKPELGLPSKYGETCGWRFRYRQRWFSVAKQFPDICCLRPTAWEILVEFTTENWSQIRRRHERPRCEFVEMGNVYVCNVGCSNSSSKGLFGELTFYPKSATTNLKNTCSMWQNFDHRKVYRRFIGTHMLGKGKLC